MTKCAEKLKEMPLGSRMTSQRKLILDYLHCVETHPTAKMVYKDIKQKLPQISFGTVYRNLNFLADHGFALALKSLNGCVHYDGNSSSHPHLICEKCGKIFDLEKNSFQNLVKTKTKHGKISKYHLNFYGLCNSCKKNS